MNYTKDELYAKARQHGFNVEMYEKQIRLIDFLDIIDKDKKLSDTFALKGGTGINLFIMAGPRLSIDIDLDYTKNCSREEMLKDRVNIRERLQQLFDNNNYEVKKESRISYILDSYKLSYVNVNGRKDFIKMDINYLDRCHIFPIEKQSIKAPWVEKEIKINCLNPIEIFASKMVALCTRAKPRDLYDVAKLKENLCLNEQEKEMLHKCVVFYSTIGAENIAEAFTNEQIWNIKQYEMKTDVASVCREKEYISVKDLCSQVDGFLKEMHQLDLDEHLYVESFKNGVYKPDYLFNGNELERIKTHPMAEYKTANYRVKKMMQQEEHEHIEEGRDGPELGD